MEMGILQFGICDFVQRRLYQEAMWSEGEGEAGVLSKVEMGPISLTSLSYDLNHAQSPVRPRELEKDRHACAQ